MFPSAPGVSFGDPHLINLDLVQYNFNGFGEYVVACGATDMDDNVARDLCNPNIAPDARTTSVHYRFGPFEESETGATVNKGISIQDPTFHEGTKRLIIVPNVRKRMLVYID